MLYNTKIIYLLNHKLLYNLIYDLIFGYKIINSFLNYKIINLFLNSKLLKLVINSIFLISTFCPNPVYAIIIFLLFC